MTATLPNRPLNVAVLGASGAVGQELLLLLEERQFPVAELKLLASARSAGQEQTWNGRHLVVEEVTAEAFQGVDLVLASAGGSVSRQWREAITSAGALMVDNSSAFRMEADVPLVVPEVNPQAAHGHQGFASTRPVLTLPRCGRGQSRPISEFIMVAMQRSALHLNRRCHGYTYPLVATPRT